MPVWPADLPQLVDVEQYRELPPMPVGEQEMDAGAPYTWGTGTDEGRVFSVQIPLDGDQVQSLDLFYRTDLRDGSLEFDWVLPREQTPVAFAFLAKPTCRHIEGDIYAASMVLETRDAAKTFGIRGRSFSTGTVSVSVGATFSFVSTTGSHGDIDIT